MYPEPVEGGKANRNRQRAVGAASLDAEGAGCATTLCPQHCRCPQHLREEEIPFLWPDGNSNKNNAPSQKKGEKKSKKNQEQPLKRCIVSFRSLNGIISKQPIKNESECVL